MSNWAAGRVARCCNALILAQVDRRLTRYDKRLNESIGETGRQAPQHPSPTLTWITCEADPGMTPAVKGVA